MQTQPNCADRVDGELASTLETLRSLWEHYCDGVDDDERYELDGGLFEEYGLGFDYVAPHTFQDQDQSYFRYQICWGGPSKEFRFYVNPDFTCYHVEFWFLDWFDGASRELRGDDKTLLLEVYEFFREIGSVEQEYNSAMET